MIDLTSRDVDRALDELTRARAGAYVCAARRYGCPGEFRSHDALKWSGREIPTLWGAPVVVDDSVPAGVVELHWGDRTVASLRLEAARP